jgi:hypothetical protein
MFRRRRAADRSETSPGPELRRAALAVSAGELGLTESEVGPVWGLIMDTGLDDGGWYTLVTLADGTTSIYTSGSFGVIGAGQHEAVRDAGRRLLGLVAEALPLFTPEESSELPAPGWVTVRALTFRGPRSRSAPEDQLGNEQDPASTVFLAAHEVIGQARMAVENGPPGAP